MVLRRILTVIQNGLYLLCPKRLGDLLAHEIFQPSLSLSLRCAVVKKLLSQLQLRFTDAKLAPLFATAYAVFQRAGAQGSALLAENKRLSEMLVSIYIFIFLSTFLPIQLTHSFTHRKSRGRL